MHAKPPQPLLTCTRKTLYADRLFGAEGQPAWLHPELGAASESRLLGWLGFRLGFTSAAPTTLLRSVCMQSSIWSPTRLMS